MSTRGRQVVKRGQNPVNVVFERPITYLLRLSTVGRFTIFVSSLFSTLTTNYFTLRKLQLFYVVRIMSYSKSKQEIYHCDYFELFFRILAYSSSIIYGQSQGTSIKDVRFCLGLCPIFLDIPKYLHKHRTSFMDVPLPHFQTLQCNTTKFTTDFYETDVTRPIHLQNCEQQNHKSMTHMSHKVQFSASHPCSGELCVRN